MTRIPFSCGLILKADSSNWVLAEERVYSAGARKGEKYELAVGYYGSIRGALNRLKEEHLKHSEARSVDDLILALDGFGAELGAALKVKVTVAM